MSSSKVLWSSPDINRSRKLHDAKQLNDTSIQSLKAQIVFFLAIITEICLNVVFKVLGGTNSSLFWYTLICKTFLVINLLFIIIYAYQIANARLLLYLETRMNKTDSILKSVIFDLLPQVKYYYEKLIKSKWLSQWLQKEALEQERFKAKLDEERHKTLYKMYLPSLHSQYNNCTDMVLKREMCAPSDSWCTGPYQQDSMFNSMYGFNNASPMSNGMFPMKPLNTSTPYSRRRVMSPDQGDVNMCPQSPMQTLSMISNNERVSPYTGDVRYDSWSHQFDGPAIKYQPSPPSNKHTNSLMTLFGTNSTQSTGILSEISSPIEIWKRLNIDAKNLDQWILNLRQWLHGTILSRVVQEIDKVNQQLVQMGLNDVVIGQSNVQTLRQLANQPGNTLPSLPVLISFIDCCKDQGYVVNRIRELSQGSSLGKYQWQSGSTSVRHPWKEHLPNDTILILHLLSTYIDSRVHSNLHGVRTFSQQFIIDNLDNKDPTDLADLCVLLQANVQPPHFKVICNQTVFDIAPGRRNLLECLIVFFYKVYKNEGNLKWLNLGRSGLNLNWIFDESF